MADWRFQDLENIFFYKIVRHETLRILFMKTNHIFENMNNCNKLDMKHFMICNM